MEESHLLLARSGYISENQGTILGKKSSRVIPPVLSTCPLHTNSGCGKERRMLIGPW